MLGPALKALFVDLHNRHERTKYEAEIHRELLGLLLADHVASASLRTRAGVRVGSRLSVGAANVQNIKVSRNHIDSLGIPGEFGEVLGSRSTVNLQVVLSGGTSSGPRELQIGCKLINCPLKKKS